MRYFIEASYHGGHYAGWQRQPNDPSVQQTLEEAFSLILREPIEITGCGRTDAGVHARQYFFHFDTAQEFTPGLLHRFNKYLPDDIGLRAAYRVADSANARFDAIRRTYRYTLSFAKDPLSAGTVLWYPRYKSLNWDVMQRIAQLLQGYDAFCPFCKEGSDTKHYLCQMFEAQWDVTDRMAIFTISANRFLRGMVRLIVGACLDAGSGKLSVEAIRQALDRQTHLTRAVSAPAHGLCLERIEYPAGILAGQVM